MIELALATQLEAQGISVACQVYNEMGVADIVTPHAIYEIKDVLTRQKLREAIAQVLAYRACLNPSAKAIVVGRRPQGKQVDTHLALAVGVEIMVWE